jgi:hypothetical protein
MAKTYINIFKGPQKFTQIGIFGSKINHLATLVMARMASSNLLHTSDFAGNFVETPTKPGLPDGLFSNQNSKFG